MTFGSRRVNPSGSPMRPFAERKIDAFFGTAPESQGLRTQNRSGGGAGVNRVHVRRDDAQIRFSVGSRTIRLAILWRYGSTARLALVSQANVGLPVTRQYPAVALPISSPRPIAGEASCKYNPSTKTQPVPFLTRLARHSTFTEDAVSANFY